MLMSKKDDETSSSLLLSPSWFEVGELVTARLASHVLSPVFDVRSWVEVMVEQPEAVVVYSRDDLVPVADYERLVRVTLLVVEHPKVKLESERWVVFLSQRQKERQERQLTSTSSWPTLFRVPTSSICLNAAHSENSMSIFMMAILLCPNFFMMLSTVNSCQVSVGKLRY